MIDNDILIPLRLRGTVQIKQSFFDVVRMNDELTWAVATKCKTGVERVSIENNCHLLNFRREGNMECESCHGADVTTFIGSICILRITNTAVMDETNQ